MKIIRNVRLKVEKALKRSPIVLLIGARQTGKTTLVKQIAEEQGYRYVSFDDIRFLSIAREDPMGFIEQMSGPIIFDEIQRVPDLFLAIKHVVDQERVAGQYLLTGSANPLLLSTLGDSLAGRMEILTIYPFSQTELLGLKTTFIDKIFNSKTVMNLTAKPFSKEGYYQKILTGGYPVVQSMSGEDRDAWFNNYITAVVQKDVIDIAHIENLSAIPRLLSILSASSSSLLNASSLSRASGIPLTTLKRYFVLLQTLFILFFNQSWSTNLIKRITKSPKPYLIDSGLSAWLQMITMQKITSSFASIGHLVENFIVTELQKQLSWSDYLIRMYHFRKITGIEVDILLERFDGLIVGIEVKSSSNITKKDVKSLVYLQEHIKDKLHCGVVLYMGNEIIPLAKDIVALPISALWSN